MHSVIHNNLVIPAFLRHSCTFLVIPAKAGIQNYASLSLHSHAGAWEREMTQKVFSSCPAAPTLLYNLLGDLMLNHAKIMTFSWLIL